MMQIIEICRRQAKIVFIHLLFICIFISKSSAQNEWAPIGAKWVNEENRIEEGLSLLITFESVKDTLYLGKNCKKILNCTYCYKADSKQPCDSAFDTSYFYLYNDNGKIYYSIKDSFILMYDFTLKAGDTFVIYEERVTPWMDPFRAVTYVIDSIDITQISGKQLKRQYIHAKDDSIIWNLKKHYHYYEGSIIERIGSENYLFGTYFSPYADIPPYLKCYKDSEIFYQDTAYVNCSGLEAVAEIKPQIDFQLYPNPSSEEVILTNPVGKIYDLQVFNIFGNVMIEQRNIASITNTIPVQSLENGIYIIILYSENTRFLKKFIKN